MVQVNANFAKLQSSYLFSTIGKKVREYQTAHPRAEIIRLGIGDVTRPLPAEAIAAMHAAVDEMAHAETFKGYPTDIGITFLEEAIRADYALRGVALELDEIFLSDGAKSDCGNIGDIFGTENIVAVCDPIYPVYVDTNVMAGRAGNPDAGGHWNRLVYLDCTAETGFLPQLPGDRADLVYLCSPNNPTGTAMNRAQLQAWVDWANENASILLYDGAYEAYITEDLPRSIYEIPGAETCAIEFRSFSKTAGFTGVRCAYTIVPKALKSGDTSIHALWGRRQATKFNGVSYITQRGAEATFTAKGRAQVRETIAYYLQNAGAIKAGLESAGFSTWGGVNSPYVWLKAPDGMTSWELFDLLLNEAQVVGTPGAGFGPAGEGYFRLTGFGTAEKTRQAVERIQTRFAKFEAGGVLG
ncbi:MAG: LL-diaminopimelate aminotransferase [Oscillospiraceae bacterium]|jgi:LL-diaminopimelate aminotransferase|nr:LL-diaminopimelate aminotransferase [Oscillospiraceae bacterium]